MRLVDPSIQNEEEEDSIVARFFKEELMEGTTPKTNHPSTSNTITKINTYRSRRPSFSFFKNHESRHDSGNQISNDLSLPQQKEEKTLKRIARNLFQWAESANMGPNSNQFNNNNKFMKDNNSVNVDKIHFKKDSESAPDNYKTHETSDVGAVDGGDDSIDDYQYITTKEFNSTKTDPRLKRPNTVPTTVQQDSKQITANIRIIQMNDPIHEGWVSNKKPTSHSNLKPNDNHLNRDLGTVQLRKFTGTSDKIGSERGHEKDIQNYINERISSLATGGHPSLFSLNLPACSFKSIMLTGFPPRTSLNSVLAQVCGGPLERIQLFHKNNLQKPMSYNFCQEIDWDVTYLQLRFCKDEDALSFLDYGSTGMFTVNGCHVLPSRYPFIYDPGDFDNEDSVMGSRSENPQSSEIMKESIENKEKDKIANLYVTDGHDDSKPLLNSKAVCKLMEMEGARRVLVFKKPIKKENNSNTHSSSTTTAAVAQSSTTNTTSKSKSYPFPSPQYSQDFDIEEVKRDFMRFGSLVDINGVVSRKLCFAVHYMDVKDAIHVKNLCERKDISKTFLDTSDGGASMYDKYKGWFIWYGKDPVDKPGIIID